MLLPVLKETGFDLTRRFELLGRANRVQQGLVHFQPDQLEYRSLLRILPEASGIRGISLIHTNGRRGPNAPTAPNAPAYPSSADELSVTCGPNAPTALLPHSCSDRLRPWVINRLDHTTRSQRPGTNENAFIVRCRKRRACTRRRRTASRRRIFRDNFAKRF
jgi:hypothetical protein